jgi:hypothetical protein
MDIRSFSDPWNFPPSGFGRSVKTHLLWYFFVICSALGMSLGARKSNRISA